MPDQVLNAATIKSRIHDLLGEGFGVEDIALDLDVPVEDVRFEVRALRASGDLERVLFGDRG